MMSDEQIRVSERRHFIDNARSLAQSSEPGPASRRDRPRPHVERDMTAIATFMAFVLPGLLFGAWSARLYLLSRQSDVQSVLYRNAVFVPHSRYDILEAARETILQLPLWSVSAVVAVLLVGFVPVVNLFKAVAR